ncbi:hypothetical protein SASPL_103927 [Salvia splendens]|uniref:Pectinesterase n=1 Tax=Salvia splendens TaxID=180675 RepID=A0A8X8YH07_SALSN|nr:hypothetical protein SASPL_103927 [Salvia splendens]
MSCFPTTFALLLLIAAAAKSAPIKKHVEAVEATREGMRQAVSWANGFKLVTGLGRESGFPSRALLDCAVMYEDAESRLARLVTGEREEYWSRDDAVTWLSAALAGHNACLDGLGDMRVSFEAHNLTEVIRETLGLYRAETTNPMGKGKGKTVFPRKPSPVQGGGSLAAWNAATSNADYVVAQDGSGSFKGYQDTLYTLSLRQFYRSCHVYGTVDFIFGDAAAVLEDCDILVRRPMDHQSNFITAQGRSDPNQNTGISVVGCRVRPAPDLRGAEGRFETFLGRPWKKFSRTVFVKTDLDGLIDRRGWKEWSGGFALATLYYAEFMNTGGGASTAGRVKWPGFHVLIDAREAEKFSARGFIGGDQWIPATGVPF